MVAAVQVGEVVWGRSKGIDGADVSPKDNIACVAPSQSDTHRTKLWDAVGLGVLKPCAHT